MFNNRKRKLEDFNLFGVKHIKITGNRVRPFHEFIEFKKQDIHRSIAHYFESQVRQYSQNIAVKTKTGEINYRQLNERANQTAQTICDFCGKKTGGVCLLFEHDVDMIVGIIAALKANKFYIPLDPAYPLSRLIYILEDSKAGILLTNDNNIHMAEELKSKNNHPIKIINISKPGRELPDRNLELEINPNNPAYILYTSGSTGKPKGVLQSQRNVLHFIRLYTNNLHIHSNDRLTLFSSYGFDAAVMDIFGTLLNGAALYPLNIMEEGNFERLPAWLNQERITIYHSIPTVYRYFINMLRTNGRGVSGDEELFPHLRLLVLGGEAVYRQDVENYKTYFPGDCLFINGLGPTESTVTLQYFLDKNTPVTKNAVPVGFPVDETSVILLDKNNREAQVYKPGEILYKSEYLALGYINNPGKTAEVFFTDPLTGSGRVFRTGDFGRRLPDGNIEFLGREDFQVKIRGYRVELGEIENVLDRLEGVEKSVLKCIRDNNGENVLAAYYICKKNSSPGESDVSSALSKILPGYMIPSIFLKLETFPLTPTGKIERQSLPHPDLSQFPSIQENAPPRNAMEMKLAEMWTDVLKIDKNSISITDNFFQLGGHSLKAIVLVSKIHKEFDVKVPLADLFRTPTIRELSKYIEEAAKERYMSIGPVEKKEYYPLSSAQRRFYILQQIDINSTAYNMPIIIKLEGQLEKENAEVVFKKLLDRHQSLRTSFELKNEEPVQRIHDEIDFTVKYHEASETESDRIVKNFVKPFDLSRHPLLKLELVKVSGKEHVLMFDMHHIVTDGTSMGIFINDLLALYVEKNLPPLRLQYKDFSQWQYNLLARGQLKKQENYWLDHFSGELPVLNMPTDYPRPRVQSFQGDSIGFHFEKELSTKLKLITEESGATLYMMLLALYNILLSKWTEQEDIIVGTPIAGRNHTDLENIIGLLLETIAIRNYPGGDKTFEEFLGEVRKNTLSSYENQSYPFREIIKQVGNENDRSRNPLFDVMLIVQNIDTRIESQGIEELRVVPYSGEKGSNKTAKVDITLTAVERENGISLSLEYCTKLFKRNTMEVFIDSFKEIASAVAGNRTIKLNDIQVSFDLGKATSNIYESPGSEFEF